MFQWKGAQRRLIPLKYNFYVLRAVNNNIFMQHGNNVPKDTICYSHQQFIDIHLRISKGLGWDFIYTDQIYQGWTNSVRALRWHHLWRKFGYIAQFGSLWQCIFKCVSVSSKKIQSVLHLNMKFLLNQRCCRFWIR